MWGFIRQPMVPLMPRLKQPNLALLAVASLLTLSLAGCSKVYVPSFIKVYEPDIEQGNVLEADQVSRIHVGMTRNEVHRILGTPALNDIFHRNQRETYVFYDKPGKEDVFQHNLVLTYDASGAVSKIEQSGHPLDKAPSKDLPDTKKKTEKTKKDGKTAEPEDKDLYKLSPPKTTPPGASSPGTL